MRTWTFFGCNLFRKKRLQHNDYLWGSYIWVNSHTHTRLTTVIFLRTLSAMSFEGMSKRHDVQCLSVVVESGNGLSNNEATGPVYMI